MSAAAAHGLSTVDIASASAITPGRSSRARSAGAASIARRSSATSSS